MSHVSFLISHLSSLIPSLIPSLMPHLSLHSHQPQSPATSQIKRRLLASPTRRAISKLNLGCKRARAPEPEQESAFTLASALNPLSAISFASTALSFCLCAVTLPLFSSLHPSACEQLNPYQPRPFLSLRITFHPIYPPHLPTYLPIIATPATLSTTLLHLHSSLS